MTSESRAKDEARTRVDRGLRVLLPVAVLALGVVVWELLVRIGNIPPYVLPGPRLVFSTLISDWAVLGASLLVTLTTTLEGFLLAAAGGVGLAVLFNQSRLIEYSLYPYAVILQVTPIVAIAPLLLIYLPQQAAVLACAWIVAFFPVLANTTLGLRSAYRIVESGYRLNIPRMFAALLLLSVAGIVIFFALSLVSHLLLRRWHESAIVREV